MDFYLDDTHKMLQKLFREFVEEQVKPLAQEIDAEERFPSETIEKMGKLGMLGVGYPTEYGGSGGDMFSYALLIEELSKACMTTGTAVGAHMGLCCYPILHFGSEEIKKKYLPDLLSGKKIGGFGLTEPNAGSDASKQQTTAVLEGDHYVLNGAKSFITNATVGDVFIVFAMTDVSKGTRGISAFIVEKDFPGFSTGKHEHKMGIKGSSTADLIFQDCIVPKENLLGREGKGFGIAMSTLDEGRVGASVAGLGIAEGAIEEAVKYTKDRVQFGRRLSQFQNTQFVLADLEARTSAARMLAYQAAWLGAKKDPGYGIVAAKAKLFCSENASYVTTKALQLFGGYGYIREYNIERMMRDARILEIFEGTSEVQKMVIAASMGVN